MLSLTLGSTTFEPSRFAAKIEGAVLDGDGQPASKEAENFTRYAQVFGFLPDDLGKSIMLSGKPYTINCVAADSPKASVLLEDADNGRRNVVAPRLAALRQGNQHQSSAGRVRVAEVGMITREQIETLASRNGVRRIAVENFLGTLGLEGSALAAKLNLRQDARDYKWNAATQSAIARGIDLFYAEERSRCELSGFSSASSSCSPAASRSRLRRPKRHVRCCSTRTLERQGCASGRRRPHGRQAQSRRQRGQVAR